MTTTTTPEQQRLAHVQMREELRSYLQHAAKEFLADRNLALPDFLAVKEAARDFADAAVDAAGWFTASMDSLEES